MTKRTVIIGAGLAGLSAAWHLEQKGIECVVLEREAEPGGLCRSKTQGNFVFDYCGHVLHFRHQYAFNFARRLMGEALHKLQRSSWVYFRGDYVHYPFQANLHGLPPSIVKQCLLGFITAQENRQEKPYAGDFSRWIDLTFGPGIGRYFMVPYNRKFWTIHPRRMTCEWMDGFIPVPTLADVVEGSVEDSRKRFGYNAEFWYPAQGGIGSFISALAREVKGVRLKAEVVRVEIAGRKVILADGKEIPYDRLVTTMPLPRLVAISRGISREAAAAGKRLRWNSIINVNLGLRGDATCGRHWVYFPQKDLSFFRLGYFSNFSRANAPPGHTSMYVELSYPPRNPVGKEQAAKRIRRDLGKIGIRSSSICCEDINDIQYAYPIFDTAYALSRRTLIDFYHCHGVIPCGRYGAWRYMSMQDVIMDGKRAAEEAIL